MWLQFSKKVATEVRESLQSRRASFYHGAKIPQFCGFAPRGKLVGECLPQTLLCALAGEKTENSFCYFPKSCPMGEVESFLPQTQKNFCYFPKSSAMKGVERFSPAQSRKKLPNRRSEGKNSPPKIRKNSAIGIVRGGFQPMPKRYNTPHRSRVVKPGCPKMNTPTSQRGLRPMVSASPNFSGRRYGAPPYAPLSMYQRSMTSCFPLSGNSQPSTAKSAATLTR